MVGTGGKRQESVPKFGCHAGVVQGQFLDVFIKIGKLLLGLRLIELVIPKRILPGVVDL